MQSNIKTLLSTKWPSVTVRKRCLLLGHRGRFHSDVTFGFEFGPSTCPAVKFDTKLKNKWIRWSLVKVRSFTAGSGVDPAPSGSPYGPLRQGFLGFGALNVTKPNTFLWFGLLSWTPKPMNKTPPSLLHPTRKTIPSPRASGVVGFCGDEGWGMWFY